MRKSYILKNSKSTFVVRFPGADGIAETANITHSAGHETRPDNNETFLNSTKLIRILGLMALISYMIVILFTWMYANLDGYVYFSAGEPKLSIKYLEWILGFTGIFVAVDFLLKEIGITWK